MELPNKEKFQDFLSVIKFAASDLPEFKEEKDVDWIIYGTEKNWKNLYPDFLLWLYNNSATHNAIVNNKVNYIVGNGLEIDTQGLNTLDHAKMTDAIQRANKYDETVSDIAHKICLDDLLFAGVYIELCFNKAGKDFEYYHMDYNRLRLDKDEEGFWYSEDWKKSKDKQTKEETGLEYIPLWTPDSPRKGKYIMWFKDYRPGLKWYPYPEYIGAISYIQCDYEIANFHLNNLRSNFHLGTIINFNNGKPDEATKAAIEEKLEEKFGGTDNAGKTLISFNTNKENAVTITRLAPSDLDKQFTILKQQVEESIFIGHTVTSPMLMGVKTEGQLGGRGEIEVSYEVFKNTYVKRKQKRIEKIFNKILELKGFTGRVKCKEVSPIKEKLSEQALMDILTQNELREREGFPSIPGGDSKQEPEPQKPIVSSAIHHFGEHLNCKHEFSDQELDEVLGVFRKFAKPKSEYEIVSSKSFESLEDAFKFEKAYFEEEDYLLPEGSSKGKDGKKAPNLPKIKIMYSYEPRPGLEPIIPTTREFCRELIDIDGLYSRADIGGISSIVGWDVWKHRGGYWTREGGRYTSDYCRHIWRQHIVKSK